jgi:homoserine O-succinyltransferase
MNGTDIRIIKSRSGAERRSLTIGLVNNMPLAACSATERQFRQVLEEAAGEQDLRLQCFRPAAGDGGAGLPGMEAIFESDLDGVIVTGAEPQSTSLRDEPIWPLITRLVDWGEDQGLPMVWSCLAAHAAVLYLDGIERVRLDQKLSGLFKGQIMASDHPLLQGLADAWAVPHSRCNDLPEETLAANGYRVLLRSPGAGVDLFQKASNPDFVFLQSHPEYDADSLRREFHRDVRRFVAGERDEAPGLPHSYFGSIAGSLPAFPDDWSSVHRENAEAILAWLNGRGYDPVPAPWRPTAVTLYRNWLQGLAARKASGRDEGVEFPAQAVHHHDLQQGRLVSC